MDTHSKLRQLMAERGWTAYRLAKESGLSESTLANIFKRNTVPSISTLESVCSAFGISLAQFFSESEMVEMTPELKELFDNWVSLTPEQKQAALHMIRAMNAKKTSWGACGTSQLLHSPESTKKRHVPTLDKNALLCYTFIRKLAYTLSCRIHRVLKMKGR